MQFNPFFNPFSPTASSKGKEPVDQPQEEQTKQKSQKKASGVAKEAFVEKSQASKPESRKKIISISHEVVEKFKNVDESFRRVKRTHEHNYPTQEIKINQKAKYTSALNLNLMSLRKVITDLNSLPPSERRVALELINQKILQTGGVFKFQDVQEYARNISNIDSNDLVTKLIDEIKSMGAPTAFLPIASPNEASNVTLLCPLMIDGMGDVGIAMNALQALNEGLSKNTNLRLVILVPARDKLNPEQNQMEKVLKMIGKDPRIEVIEVPFKLQAGGPGSVAQCTPENKEKLSQIMQNTDVLLNLPVEYIEGIDAIKEILAPNAKLLVSTEYGLRASDEKKLKGNRIETGPVEVMYINEGRASFEKMVEVLRSDPDVKELLPGVSGMDKETAEAGLRDFIEKKNLTMFYLNDKTDQNLSKLYLEQYLMIHKDDKRDLAVMAIGMRPLDEKYLKKLKKDFGFSSIVVHQKDKPEVSYSKAKDKPGKELHLYFGNRFKNETYKMLSEFSVLTSKEYPNIFIASGDGSFTDGLSLLANYSTHPENEDSFASIPLFIPRLPFHERSVSELIELCGRIKEPLLKELFARYKNIANLSDKERLELANLSKSLDVKVGLAKLASYLVQEHNLSRNLPEFVHQALAEQALKVHDLNVFSSDIPFERHGNR